MPEIAVLPCNAISLIFRDDGSRPHGHEGQEPYEESGHEEASEGDGRVFTHPSYREPPDGKGKARKADEHSPQHQYDEHEKMDDSILRTFQPFLKGLECIHVFKGSVPKNGLI